MLTEPLVATLKQADERLAQASYLLGCESSGEALPADAEGKVKPVIDRRLPMRELPAAYALMGSRKVRGKLVMTND